MKILIILPLIISLNACLMTDKKSDKAVIVEGNGQGEVVAIIGEKASFEWKESDDPFSKLEVMPEADRKKVVEKLLDSGVNSNLYFNYDGTEISEEASEEIVKHAQFMQDNPIIRLRLEGHTDSRGTREYNLALGENRALAVKKMMDLYGNISNRIEIISYGEEKSQKNTSDEADWQQDRRVEFIYK